MFIIKKKLCVTALVSLLVLAINAEAKDLTHRLGVGLKNNTSESVPSVAVAYHYSKDFSYIGGFGFDTQKNYSTMQIHGGARQVIYFENNLNFYAGGQVGLANYENPVDGKSSGLEFLATIGTEFFFTGLENLAFTIEAGVGLSTVKNTRLRTVANDPFKSGIIFYF